MDKEAKRQLARWVMDTIAAREASYHTPEGEPFGYYTLGWWQAAAQAGVDEDMQPLVYALAVSGYYDFPDWADSILRQSGASQAD